VAGDTILQGAAKVIESCIHRPADELGRYGGEEFCVILPNTDDQGAMKVAECIREKLEKHSFKIEGNIIKVQASLGCFVLKPDKECSIKTYYKRADEALYKAKNAGRNKVVLWEKNFSQ